MKKGREKFRLSANCSFLFDFEGNPFVVEQTLPNRHFRVAPEFLALLAQFATKGGMSLEQAFKSSGLNRRTKKLAFHLRHAMRLGLLVKVEKDTSFYDQSVVGAYREARSIPERVSDELIRQGGITRKTRILDVGAGTGLLSVQLAAKSKNVVAMDISQSFLAEARRAAKKAGVPLQTVRGSGNQLQYRDEKYDLIVMAQVFHWLDGPNASKGIHHLLDPNGQLFVVSSFPHFSSRHPMASLIGVKLAKSRQMLLRHIQQMEQAIPAGAFALDSRSTLNLKSVRIFRQTRIFGVRYFQSYFTQRHFDLLGIDQKDFWAKVIPLMQEAPPESLYADMHWTVMRFCRGGKRIETDVLPKIVTIR